jgi:hypothetical protein
MAGAAAFALKDRAAGAGLRVRVVRIRGRLQCV